MTERNHTERNHTERVLDLFLAPERDLVADRLPDRVLQAALADIDQTRQRSVLALWRPRTMLTSFRGVAGAAAAVVVVAVAAAALVLRPTIGPSATPSPTIQPSPTVAAPRDCGDLIPTLWLAEPCIYHSAQFELPLTVTANGEWVSSTESASALAFQGHYGEASGSQVKLALVRRVGVSPCEDFTLLPETPTTAAAYLEWLEQGVRDAVDAVPATRLGLTGYQLDVEPGTIDTDACPVLMLSLLDETTSGDVQPMYLDDGMSPRLYVLDAPDGGILLVQLIPGGLERDLAPAETLLDAIVLDSR